MKNIKLKRVTKFAEHFQVNLIFTLIVSHALHFLSAVI